MRFLVLLLIVASRPLEAQVDSIRREGPFTPDTIREPEYSFTGHEDPLLLARGIQATYQLMLGREGRNYAPRMLCLGIGFGEWSDVPKPVLEVLKDHDPPVTSLSGCRKARPRYYWTLIITSLKVEGDTASVFVTNFPVLGLHCRAVHERNDWRVFFCSLRWVS